MTVAIGVVLVIVGIAMLTNVLGLVERAGRVWPRRMTRGDVANLVSTNFLLRFVSVSVIALGLTMIAIALT